VDCLGKLVSRWNCRPAPEKEEPSLQVVIFVNAFAATAVFVAKHVQGKCVRVSLRHEPAEEERSSIRSGIGS
jgi:hypothetical protein